MARDQRHLSEVLSLVQYGNNLFLTIFYLHDFHFTGIDEISAVARISLLEDHLSRLVYLVLEQAMASQKTMNRHSYENQDAYSYQERAYR